MTDRNVELHEARGQVGASWGTVHPDRWASLVKGVLPGETFLDVGCSSGGYVRRLRESSFAAWGVDVLTDQEWAESMFLVADAASIAVRDRAVSTAFAFEVMEHVVDPVAFLRELRRVASRRVVISVPNCTVPDALRRAGFTFHHWVDPTHRHYFDSGSLQTAMEDAGLRVDTITTFNPVRPEYLALRGFGLGASASDRVARLLERAPRRHRYDMTLLAQATVPERL